MNGKIVILIAVVALVGAGFYFMGPSQNESMRVLEKEEASATSSAQRSVPQAGSYTVIEEESEVAWSAKKPLIEGYVNSGTIGLKEGSIEIKNDLATGSFVMDMNTLKVGLTAAKPGKESALEGHLKKADFFDVEKYPTAEFKITSVAPRADSTTTFMYDVTGDLTMKGVTHQITFPAMIYEEGGKVYAKADTEIDRTKWGITYNSGAFFDNLANNMIDDKVALSFEIVAQK